MLWACRSGINKPVAVMDWLEKTQPVEEYILILDADMIMLKPFDPVAMGVRPGEVSFSWHAWPCKCTHNEGTNHAWPHAGVLFMQQAGLCQHFMGISRASVTSLP